MRKFKPVFLGLWSKGGLRRAARTGRCDEKQNFGRAETAAFERERARPNAQVWPHKHV